tara:strand:- start:1631 stop:2308 length:678 start_codon:yes stop_codon:yes gene_type:complete
MFISASENIGILCKGQSLKSLNKIEDKFEKCLIVNDFKKEIDAFENILKKKEIIHFVSRISKVSLSYKQYKKFNIKSVQMSVAYNISDYQFIKSYLKYKLFKLKVNFTPLSFLNKLFINLFNKTEGTNKNFNYISKFPNTGLLSIFYAAEYLNVKNIYICGLDFYSSDYVFRNKRALPLETQYQKFLKLDLINFYLNFIKEKKDINFYMLTNYKFSHKPNNLILI